MKSSTTQVLIVGAGPTGLTAATVLGKQGVKVRIVEKLSSATTQSKAIGVQSGTLECLEQVFGTQLTDQLTASGVLVKQAVLHFENNKQLSIDLSIIPSRYNYVLAIPQNETERILEEEMNSFSIQVERSSEVIETQEQGEKVISKIRKADGTIEEILSDFVLGCDGAHSIVRHQTNIPFEGNPYVGNFILGDVEVQWTLPDKDIQIFLGKKGVAACFPLPGEHRFRVILIPKVFLVSDSLDISLDEFTEAFSLVCPLPIKIKKSFWLSRFRVNHRRASHFQKGRLFLLGDAAHIHSPLGGQGMNTGIQDAVNLCTKIAEVLQKGAPLSFLENYEEERIPVAKNILSTTDVGTRYMLLGQIPLLQSLIFKILPIVGRSRWLQKKVALAISQIQVARKEIQLRLEKK